jgi:hypothetical protein
LSGEAALADQPPKTTGKQYRKPVIQGVFRPAHLNKLQDNHLSTKMKEKPLRPSNPVKPDQTLRQ